MSREIKFRVWDIQKQKFAIEPRLHINLLNSEPYKCYVAEFGNTIQFFTGLTDKNGKEIYEGDILLDLDNEKGIVKYNHGSFIVNTIGKDIIIPFYSILYKDNMVQPRIINPKTFEVIGNVFENPELLKIKVKSDNQ